MAVRKTQDEFLLDLDKVHGSDIITSDRYINNKTKLLFRCTICNNSWLAIPGDILRGHGCPKCGVKKRSKSQTKTPQSFLNELRDVSGGTITTDDRYVSSEHRLVFHCVLCGNRWKATPNNILRGSNCPNCKSSSGEQSVRAILEFNSIDYDSQYNFKIKGKTHRLDFVLKDSRGNWCVIQPDGEQHYISHNGFYRGTKLDRDENNYLPALGVRVLRIPWFWFDLDNTFILLQDFLGYELKKPSKDYVPMYKNIKDMVYDYLEHGNAKCIAKKYGISRIVVFRNFKKYFGMPRSEYTKLHPEYKTFRKPSHSTRIISIDSKGVQHSYPSQAEASRQVGTSISCIGNCLHGRQKTTGGYRWEYAN